MKLQLRDIFNAKEAFARLLEEPLPTKTAMTIRELVTGVNEHFATLEEERNDLIKKNGTANEDGTFQFTPEAQEEFMKEFDGLLNNEIEFDWESISIKDLADATISVKDLNTLSFLFTELAEEAEPVAV